MKKRDYLGESVSAAVFSSWRGRPLYIYWVYLSAQILIAPPVFLLSILYLSFVTQVELDSFIAPVSIIIGGMVAGVLVFYIALSRTIRRFLSVIINADLPDQELATAAWTEAVTFPQRTVAWVSGVSVVVYTLTVILFTPRFGFSVSLVGSVVGIIATVALSQVVYLFYLERTMHPVARLALAAGAHPSVDDIKGLRLRLQTKLLLLIIMIIILPVTVMGLFGYAQVVALGGDPEDSLGLTGLVALVSSGLAVMLVVLLIRSISRPIQEMQMVAEEVGQGNLEVSVQPLTTDELAELALRFNEMVEQLKQQEPLKAAFGRYVSEAVRDGILSGTIALGGERREVSILFTDIRGFTMWCEQTPPESVIQTINSYFENLIQAMTKHGGTVTRYTGDGVLALFGAPLDDPNHALNAVQAAWEAHNLLDKFNSIRRSVEAFELSTGFGIHSGSAVVGSIGCEARAEYTPIGDAANVASRIEGLNKELNTAILISEATYQRVADHVVVGKRAETSVKGREKPIEVIEVIGMRNGADSTDDA
jgi:class 3 adenylate cyclase